MILESPRQSLAETLADVCPCAAHTQLFVPHAAKPGPGPGGFVPDAPFEPVEPADSTPVSDEVLAEFLEKHPHANQTEFLLRHERFGLLHGDLRLLADCAEEVFSDDDDTASFASHDGADP